jgi:hypothetical protein
MPETVLGRDEAAYRDVQRIPFWVYGILAVIAGGMGYIATTLPRPWNLGLGAGAVSALMIGLIIAVIFSTMTTEVTPTVIRSRFGLYRFEMPLGRVRGVEVVEVDPWSTENWGVPGPRIKGGYLGLRGRGGIKLSFDDGKGMVLGSDNPEGLAEAVRSRIGRSAPMVTST